ncbi:hypothetical protein [uncultured Sneathiella sp.]|jgi:hypothetical protein|uniref:hypothetical protein n=1 Tax=uncultured Sneathiella sp. TaxID=879315 RepID=UPI0030DDC848|tara:strand:+ start:1794 stop:1961 length:168 start_codon:yes stop_codon:yes gene_type:complete
METGVQKYPEPALKDLLSDPVMLAVLKRDGLSIDDLKKVVTTYREKFDSSFPDSV